MNNYTYDSMNSRNIIILFLVAGVIGFGYYAYQYVFKVQKEIVEKRQEEVYSYLNLSINPDIQLTVDEDNIVKDVVSLNEDADVLTSDLLLNDLNVEEATDNIIDSAITMGYIDEFSSVNAIVVSAINETEEIRNELELRIKNRINTNLETKKIYAVVTNYGVSDELKEKATLYDISNGKMLLIDKAITLNKDLKEEDLVNLSINEIQQEIKDQVKERQQIQNKTNEEIKLENQNKKEEIINKRKEQVENIKQDLLNKANINSNNMTNQQKEETTNTVIEKRKEEIKEESIIIEEKLNIIKEKDATIIKEEMENIKETIIDNNTNNTTKPNNTTITR